MVDIGERLRDAREKKSLTIDQAQKQTRIHSTVLAALEEGRCDDLLTPTYVRSFLKKYAEFLGLDPKKFLKDYSAFHPETDSRKPEMPGEKEAVDLSGFIYALKSVLVIVAILALAAFLGKKTVDYLKGRRPPKPAAQAVVKAKKMYAAPSTAARRKVSPKAAAAAPKETAVPASSIPKKTALNLVVRVKQTVLIQLKKDGILIFKRVLTKGMVESFTADESFNIFTAKAEATELTLNGKPLGPIGKGVVKDIEITRRGVKIR